MPYQSYTAIENDVTGAAGGPNAAFTELITLPNNSWEGRTSHAIRIGAPGAEKIGVYVIGGLHAREWGSSDILVRLIGDLTQAYRTNHSLTYGGKTFSAADVQRIVNGLNLYVFPQANPDGRLYSMTSDIWWRKNRRPDADPNHVGVDLNRNYDFLWNFPAYFSPSAPIQSSTDPASDVYIGPSVESEPETRNVVSIGESRTDIRFFVDVHSYSQLLLYAWGDDELQTSDPAKNFHNPAYDHQRGVAGDAYSEYIPTADRDLEAALGNRMKAAIAAAGGPAYTVESSYDLYPTSGTSTERWIKKHYLDRGNGKVHGYTIEWGTEFQPPWSEMANIVEQICAGLLDLCLGILDTYADLYIRDSASDTGSQPTGNPFWESPDIVIRRTDDGVFTHEDPITGQDNFLYVRVTNRGPNPSGPFTVNARVAAFAGTEFVFPQDWDASDAMHVAPSPVLASFPSLAVGATAVAKFKLTTAQVNQLGTWHTNGWHPCLLADVDGVNDYRPSAGRHVWEDNNLGQRNITVIHAIAGQQISWSFLVGNKLRDRGRLTLDLHLADTPQRVEAHLDLLDPTPRFPHVEGIRLPDVERAVEPAGATRLTTAVPPRLAPYVLDTGGAAVVGDDRPALRLHDTRTVVELAGLRRELAQAVVHVTVPDTAKVGEVYRFRVAQRDESGQVVGGVTLEVPIVEG